MADKPKRKHKFRKGTPAFRTPSGGVSAHGREKAEKEGDAMKGGRFPIRNKADLENAKHAFGRAKDKPAVRRFIDKRAHELGEPPLGGSAGRSRDRYKRKTVKRA